MRIRAILYNPQFQVRKSFGDNIFQGRNGNGLINEQNQIRRRKKIDGANET
jgi:hypothetical protein